ncbi:FMRFamide receptor-like [Tubulanus polymorphus]|uniref:FMRFamide receptor-like n=1 Tax=Tubulanus polymorphus TaxID=672921 RepID=UPI003DA4D6BC
MDLNDFSPEMLAAFLNPNSNSTGGELKLMLGNYSCLELQLLSLSADVMSQEEVFKRKVIKYYLMGIVGLIVCALGIIGNIVSFVVIIKLGMRTTSTYIYLGALAVCDSLVLIFTTMMVTKDVRYPERNKPEWMATPNDGDPYPYMFPYVHSFDVMFQVTAIWLTLAFTTDRFIMICHPFSAEKLCTPSRAWKVTAGLTLAGLVYNLPRFFEYKTIAMVICDVRTVNAGFTEFGKSGTFRMLFHSWFYLIFVCGVPFLALAIMNSFLIVAVHESRRRGREICAAERKRNDTTIMLIGVIVIFFICQVPALVSRMLWAFNPDLSSTPLYILNEVCNFLVILNSAINIVPYYFFGKRFRKQFWKLFCCCVVNRLVAMRRLSLSNTNLENSGVNTTCTNGTVVQMSSVPKKKPSELMSRNSSSTALLQHQDSGSLSSAGRSNQSSPTTLKNEAELNGNYKDKSSEMPLISVKPQLKDNTDCADVML